MRPPRSPVSPPEPSAGLRLAEGGWAVAGAVLVHVLVGGVLAPSWPVEGARAPVPAAGRVEVKAEAAGAVMVSHRVVPLAPVSPVSPVTPVTPVTPVSPVVSVGSGGAGAAGGAGGAAEARDPSWNPPGADSPAQQRPEALPGSGPSPAAAERVAALSPSPSAGPAMPLPGKPASGASGVEGAPVAGAVATPQAPKAANPVGLAAALPAEGDAPPPVYDTLVPPPFRLLFVLRRGALSGQAELVMGRTAAGYTLDLKGTALGLEVLGMSSRGGLGRNGLMPERFVDRRRGKDRLAANFDHAAGRITYSGTSAAQTLWPGGQDRLSWMVQLAAIVEAAPARYAVGSRMAVSVSGARGDVDTWTFVVQGRQRLSTPAGDITEALHLTREPRRPYDTQVEVWLNPAQHHLPVRARLTVLPGGETLELSLAAP